MFSPSGFLKFGTEGGMVQELVRAKFFGKLVELSLVNTEKVRGGFAVMEVSSLSTTGKEVGYISGSLRES